MAVRFGENSPLAEPLDTLIFELLNDQTVIGECDILVTEAAYQALLTLYNELHGLSAMIRLNWNVGYADGYYFEADVPYASAIKHLTCPGDPRDCQTCGLEVDLEDRPIPEQYRCKCGDSDPETLRALMEEGL